MNSKDRSYKFRNYMYDIEKDKVRTQKENYIIEVYDDEEAQNNFQEGYKNVSKNSQIFQNFDQDLAHRWDQQNEVE